jgi:hypothetical protein
MLQKLYAYNQVPDHAIGIMHRGANQKTENLPL